MGLKGSKKFAIFHGRSGSSPEIIPPPLSKWKDPLVTFQNDAFRGPRGKMKAFFHFFFPQLKQNNKPILYFSKCGGNPAYAHNEERI
jgi:hypothetical protein